MSDATSAAGATWLDRSLRVFGDVRAGEGVGVLLMFTNIFVLLMTYYILKTVREPLILTGGGAEIKSYAAAVQALVLIAYVPLYSWLASSVRRRTLLVTVVVFFFGCVQLFFLAAKANVPYLGFAFFVWVGIFSLTAISQFWSYANDIYTRNEGERLFPLIAVGSTIGAPLGAVIAERLFGLGLDPYTLMQIAAVMLLVHLGLYEVIDRGRRRTAAVPSEQMATQRREGFALVFRSKYLMLMALLLIVLNLVNTTGEYILSRQVVDAADAHTAADAAFDRSAYIGAYFGRYFFWVNIAAILIQAFVVSRLVKYGGIAAALFALPIVSLGVYGLLATGVSLTYTRWAKTLENATDYSAMNTAKQMLWLPTSREEKYQAKQAIDTFFVRFGDMLAAAVVFIGSHWLAFSASGFAIGNLLFVAGWIGITFLLLREYHNLSLRPGREKAA